MHRLKLLGLLFAVGVIAFGVLQVVLWSPRSLPEKSKDILRIASWNVHYIWLGQAEGRWGLSGWNARRGPMDTVLKSLDADLVAFQEMESFQRGSDGSVNLTRDYLLAENPDYAAAAAGPWQEFPPTQPIFYRPDRLAVLDEGWFFFSRTPNVLYSRGFDGAPPSFASWAQFQDVQTGAVFRIINVHFDALSIQNRQGAARLTADHAGEWIAAGETVFVAGDFNAFRGMRALAAVREGGFRFAPAWAASFHFDRGLHLFPAIDHIGWSGASVRKTGPFVVQYRDDGVAPSDHYPVVMDVEIKVRVQE